MFHFYTHNTQRQRKNNQPPHAHIVKILNRCEMAHFLYSVQCSHNFWKFNASIYMCVYFSIAKSRVYDRRFSLIKSNRRKAKKKKQANMMRCHTEKWSTSFDAYLSGEFIQHDNRCVGESHRFWMYAALSSTTCEIHQTLTHTSNILILSFIHSIFLLPFSFFVYPQRRKKQ